MTTPTQKAIITEAINCGALRFGNFTDKTTSLVRPYQFDVQLLLMNGSNKCLDLIAHLLEALYQNRLSHALFSGSIESGKNKVTVIVPDQQGIPLGDIQVVKEAQWSSLEENDHVCLITSIFDANTKGANYLADVQRILTPKINEIFTIFASQESEVGFIGTGTPIFPVLTLDSLVTYVEAEAPEHCEDLRTFRNTKAPSKLYNQIIVNDRKTQPTKAVETKGTTVPTIQESSRKTAKIARQPVVRSRSFGNLFGLRNNPPSS